MRLALVGLGKIARDRHLPSIARTAGVELVAVADPRAGLEGVACFPDLASLLGSGLAVDAVALCTPPQGRHVLAAAALAAGCHVLLEKPPGLGVAALAPLQAMAARAGRSLFAAWHSRFAPAVEPARRILAGRRVRAARIVWAEDVRVWHPGQAWIWEPGLGVFDPGINALSMLTAILPRPVFLTAGTLSFPAGRDAPIAAELAFSDADGAAISAVFDWRREGAPRWDIEVEAGGVGEAEDAGVRAGSATPAQAEGVRPVQARGVTLALSEGGRTLAQDGRLRLDAADGEYDAIYRRFVALAAAGESDVDLAPLVHVADAFMLGRRVVVEAFADG